MDSVDCKIKMLEWRGFFVCLAGFYKLYFNKILLDVPYFNLLFIFLGSVQCYGAVICVALLKSVGYSGVYS